MDETTKTFSLRYVGDRFEGGRLPVDVLSDLSALRDLAHPYDEHLEKCLARLHNLAKLEKGWLNGGGEQLTHIAAAKTFQFIFTYAELAKLFRIYPTEDGGISIEFGAKKWDFVVEILPDGAIEIDGSSSAGELFLKNSYHLA